MSHIRQLEGKFLFKINISPDEVWLKTEVRIDNFGVSTPLVLLKMIEGRETRKLKYLINKILLEMEKHNFI